MDPDASVGYMAHDVRASWNCGHLPPEQRTGPGVEYCGGKKWPLDVCPGYVVRSGAVAEASQAHAAATNRVFDAMFPDPTNALMEGLERAILSFNAYQAELLKRNRNEPPP